MLEPIVASPDLVDHVTMRLRGAILEGTLAPGDRLIEDQLATTLNVSRAPIREALRILEHDGLVMSIARRGRFVSQLSSRDAFEVYSLRETLEVMAFKLLVTEMPDDLLDAASGIVEAMNVAANAGDRPTLSRLDVEFHRLIVKSSGHRRLLRTWDSMVNQIGLLSLEVVDSIHADLTTVVGRHQELIDALADGDADRAASSIRDHIQSVATQVIDRLECVEARSTSRTLS
jgi:DNA-binding GntR family transcriptional regulator